MKRQFYLNVYAITASLVYGLPFIAGAQIDPTLSGTGSTATELFTAINAIVTSALPVIIGLGVLVFLYGLLKYLFSGGDETARQTGRQWMIWGIVVLFVMTAVWGLVGIIEQLTGIPEGGGTPIAPGLPGA